MALIPGKASFSVLWDRKVGVGSQEGTQEQDSALVEGTAVHPGSELLLLLEMRHAYDAEGKTSCFCLHKGLLC